MRCDQYIGLPPDAIAFLADNEAPDPVCPHCHRLMPVTREVIGHYDGMFETEYSLYRHTLTNGDYADEFMQADPWSSGPMFFIGLRVYRRGFADQVFRTFEWSEEEIDAQTA
jgi:hypothetical protein